MPDRATTNFARTLSAGLGMTAGAALLLAGVTPANAALGTFSEPDFLGDAASYAVVAGTTVTNVADLTPTPMTVVNGDIGLSPGTDVTGFPPGVVVNGSIYTADSPGTDAFDARTDADAAYLVVDGLTPDFPQPGVGPIELGETSPVPGVYQADAFLLNGTITLDGEWDDVWVFQSSSTLTTGVDSVVVLSGDANPCNVYWQVDSSATIQVGTTFVGTVLALASISALDGATVDGRLLAHQAVTLDHNQVNTPTCLTGPSTPDDGEDEGEDEGEGDGAGDGAAPGSSPGAAETLPATGAHSSLGVIGALVAMVIGLMLLVRARVRRTN